MRPRRRPTPDERARRPTELQAVGPALVAAVSFAFLAARDGGFPATSWYPVALYLVALLAVVLYALPPGSLSVDRAQAVAIGCLAAFTAWSYLSIAWAGDRAAAWDGANRTLLYLVVFSLFSLLPWTARAAVVLLEAYVFAMGVLALVILIRVGSAHDPSGFFLGTRLSTPTGYQNATAALFTAPVWAALLLASRRGTSSLARGLLLAAGVLLLDVAVLAQSRGWLFATGAVALGILLLVRRRVRSLLAMAVVGAAVAIAWPRLSHVYQAHGAEGLRAAVRATWAPIGATCAAALVLGVLWGLVDRRIVLPAGLERWSGRALGAAAVLAAAILVPLAFVSYDAAGRVGHAAHQFTRHVPSYRSSSHFSSGFAGGRYDYWRVSLKLFERHPVGGVGADNFSLPYLKLRRIQDEPKYPHSLEFRLLEGTGAVGTLLFLGFLGGAAAASVRRLRRAPADSVGRLAIAGSLSLFAYWFVHGSVDWLWEFPGLAAPAMAFLAVPGGLGPPADVGARAGGLRRRLALAAAGVGCVAAVATFVPPWLSARDVAAATAGWRTDPDGAYGRLADARRLNPWTEEPDLIAGAIATKRHDWPRARRAFDRAIARNPNDWYPHLELAVLDALQRRSAQAKLHLAAVRRLDPLEPTTELVFDRLRAGRPLTFEQLDRLFVDRVDRRLR